MACYSEFPVASESAKLKTENAQRDDKPIPASTTLKSLVKDYILDADKEVIAELEKWAIVKGPKGNLRCKLKSQGGKMWIAGVSKACDTLSEAQIALEDDEYLFLMDSGCSKHASNPAVHFLQIATEESPGQRAGQVFITASKEKLPNLGQKRIEFMTEEGTHCASIFQQAKVGMPILSIRQLGKTHRTVFADKTKNDGYIEHRKTLQRSYFSSYNGVYFMKVKVKQPMTVRPDTPFGGPE